METVNKKLVHLRVWTNNKYDRKAACGLFWRGKTHRWTHCEDEVTCEDCKKAYPEFFEEEPQEN